MANRGEALRQLLVGDEGLDLGHVRDADRRAAAEFSGIGDQHDAARVGDDGLRHLHLAIVEVEQRALLVDRGRTDDGVIDLELADQADRGRADHSAVGAAHRAARHDHLDARVPVQEHRDVEVVGDNQQVLMRGQRARDFFRRGANVDEQRAAVGNPLSRGKADRPLLLCRHETPRLIG